MKKTALLLFASLFALAAAGTAFAQQEPMNKAQVVAEIQDKLYHAKIFKHGDVQVNFEGAVATLTGTVDSLGVKEDALNAVRKVDDVTSIVDHLRVHAEDVTPRKIVEQARKQIVTYPFFTIFDWISLTAEGGNLAVTGAVTEPYKKGDIGNFLSHVKGVETLNNEIKVLPNSLFDDQIRRSIARAIYGDPYFVNYVNQALPPIHIIVDNGNVTLEGVVNSQVDKVKAETDARFATTFFSLINDLQVEKQ